MTKSARASSGCSREPPAGDGLPPREPRFALAASLAVCCLRLRVLLDREAAELRVREIEELLTRLCAGCFGT
jgi:hypothetical protein